MISNPFTYGSMITDPDRFVGRRSELGQIVARLNGGQAQGSAVYGPRRIGKSSLLHYLAFPRTSETPRPNPSLHPIYLSAAAGDCETPALFRLTLFRKILAAHQPLSPALAAVPQQLAAADFSWADCRAILTQLPKKPVVCLDEMDAWLGEEKKGVFDDRFFNALRSWANEGLLVWVTASKLPLQDYAKLHSYDSPFFNLLAAVPLGPFTEGEVQLLLARAEGTAHPFTPQERHWVQQWAGGSPYHLQMVAYELWQMKAAGRVDKTRLKAKLCVQPEPPPVCQKRGAWLRREHVMGLIIAGLLLLLYLFVPAEGQGVAAVGQWIHTVWQGLGTFGDVMGGLVLVLLLLTVLGKGIWHGKKPWQLLQDLWNALTK